MEARRLELVISVRGGVNRLLEAKDENGRELNLSQDERDLLASAPFNLWLQQEKYVKKHEHGEVEIEGPAIRLVYEKASKL